MKVSFSYLPLNFTLKVVSCTWAIKSSINTQKRRIKITDTYRLEMKNGIMEELFLKSLFFMQKTPEFVEFLKMIGTAFVGFSVNIMSLQIPGKIGKLQHFDK